MTKPPLLIAVVDDEKSIRKALMRLMRSVGLSVETFGSGPEFLESLDTRLPDCVVLDLPSTKDKHHHMKLFSELSLRSFSEKDGERSKHQSKSQFPLAVATTAARITTTMSWIAMGMAGSGQKLESSKQVNEKVIKNLNRRSAVLWRSERGTGSVSTKWNLDGLPGAVDQL